MTNQDGRPDALLATQVDELRHRLRNHLQNMISLISMQIRRARNEETIAALEDLRARFASITSIYIDLDDSSDHPVALEKFVPDLVRRIGDLYDPGGVHGATFRITPLTLAGQRAALLGQIVVELTMNVYRHAFAGRTGGRIEVELSVADASTSPLRSSAGTSRSGRTGGATPPETKATSSTAPPPSR